MEYAGSRFSETILIVMNTCTHCNAVLGKYPDRLDQIPGNEHVKRALEVALTGGHSISLFVTNNCFTYGQMLAKWGATQGLTVFVEKPCPCGNYGSQTDACTCSISMITRWKKQSHYQNAANADMVIEVVLPYAETVTSFLNGRRSEPDEAILKRVAEARRDQVSEQLTGYSTTLLRAAIVQNFVDSARATYIVIPIAKSIAGLGWQETIEPASLAEALQYQPREERK